MDRPDWDQRPGWSHIGDTHIGDTNINVNRFNNLHTELARGTVRPGYQDWHHWNNGHWNHGNWHHGYWNGHWCNGWHGVWDRYPAAAAFGVTMWGVNRLAYGFGYWDYSNPYYTQPVVVDAGTTIDYSQPLVITVPTTTQVEETAAEPAPATVEPTAFDNARTAFYQGDYASALAFVNQAIAATPNDPALHEFRGLVLFAQGDYKASAAAVHAVLSASPGWDWTTLSSMYPATSVYTEQLRKLEAYQRANPNAPEASFLLAYHYLTQGYTQEAGEMLNLTVQLTPNDHLAKSLAEMVNQPASPAADPAQPAGEPGAQPQGPTIDEQKLIGAWTAKNAAGNQFTLKLDDQHRFQWTYAEGGKQQTVSGVFALDGQTLAMEPDSGGVMLAAIHPPAGGQFHFAMIGAPSDDPGLDFRQGR